MERLTEEIQIGPWASLKNKAEAKVGAFADYDCLMAHMEAVTRLKYYEDLEEQGLLVVLPCKVGDTVYKLCPVSPFLKKGDLWSGRIVERDCDMCGYVACDCHDIGPQRDAKNIVHEMTLKSLSAIVRIIPHWGKLYFSSREEAEAALKE